MQPMDDGDILELYQQRDQRAISETQQKFGGLCMQMACSLTGSRQDAEECLNDALLRLWENIPPAQPQSLGGYLMTVCRNLALDCRKLRFREKRGSGQNSLNLDELAECIASKEHPEDTFDKRALSEAIGRFLDTQPAEARVMFVMRYWSCLSVQEVAKECGAGESKVKMTLLRTRNKLREFLEQEGYR